MAAYTLLLLDIDGVLVHPAGYKAALRAAVDVFAAQMGQPSMGPSDDEIAIFEACGITNEWDSGAICVGAILNAALTGRPDLRRGSLAETMEQIRAARSVILRPDYAALAREIGGPSGDGRVPAAIYLALLAHQAGAEHLPVLTELLQDVYSLDAPVTRVFQAHTLGTAWFTKTYGQPAPLERESYLARYDTPLLTSENRDRLLSWSSAAGHGAAILTTRPSLPPADQADESALGYAPEGELAAELLGLAGLIPLIGSGRIGWLAPRYGRKVSDYLKPSPVQALAAIGAAVSNSESPALEAAALLVEQGALTGPLATLAGHSTHVIVFEDSPVGVRATRLAVDRLHEAGLGVTFEAVGVSPQVDKRAALSSVADEIVDDINEGLLLIPGWQHPQG